MNNNRILRPISIYKAAFLSCLLLTGLSSPSFAVAPSVNKLTFIDTKGTSDTSDDTVVTMRTGDTAYRVAVDLKGAVYVTDPMANMVYKFNSNGHLVRNYRGINRPFGIALNSDGNLLVSGYSKTKFSTFVINPDTGAMKPDDIGIGMPAGMVVDAQGNIITIDKSGSSAIRIYDKDGKLLNTFGPFGGIVDGTETVGSSSYTKTRHSIQAPTGIVFDPVSGEIYIKVLEYVDYLSNIACGGTNPNCSQDLNGYKLFPSTSSDPSYQYWYPAASRYMIAVVDRTSGALKRSIPIDSYINSGCTTASCNPADSFALGLDGNGRLYVSTAYQGVKVYDAATGASLTPTGSGFAGSVFMDFAFDAVNKRLIGTSDNVVTVYGIDGGGNPLNTAPSSPTLLDPAKDAYVASLTPSLKIGNAIDKEGDPLTYTYEISDLDDNFVASATGIVSDLSGVTVMGVTSPLAERALYNWKSRSFDGNASSCWSDEKWNDVTKACDKDATLAVRFCVKVNNANPDIPVIVGPKDGVQASPFSTSLVWNASKDPDCYDTVSYMVEVSSDQSFSSSSARTLASTSISLGDLLNNAAKGSSYFWRVKAIDNNGGASDYSMGSFTYKTTTVSFGSDQPDTRVYLDGNYGYAGNLMGSIVGGTGPLDVQNITPGSHFVAFVKAGYEPFYTIINVVDDGSVLPVNAAMVAASKIRPSITGTEIGRVEVGSSSPFVVDYNNDTLKDLLAGGRDGRIYLYMSERQIVDGKEKVVLVAAGVLNADNNEINVGSRAVPFVVDYNNDGRKDLLVGSGDGSIHLYLNTGSESSPIFTAAGTLKDGIGNGIRVSSNAAPAVVDYNNDGKKDLVAGGADGTLRVYLNIGSDSSPVFDPSYIMVKSVEDTILNVGSNSKPFFTDWDSDGKIDLLIGGGSVVKLYLNTGSGLSGSSPVFAYNHDMMDMTGGGGDASPFVVDWDGTSARDIVVGNSAGTILSYVSACGGLNPSNNPPSAPVLLFPLNGVYAATVNPVLTLANASDVEGCPVTYGYEIADSAGVVVASDSGISEGQDGKTYMTVNQPLTENSMYTWRAKAFDGDAATGTTWSDWSGLFFVNATNESPSVPVVIAPVNKAAASIYSTTLTWNKSTDPDIYDTVSYLVELSTTESFANIIASRTATDTSVKLGDLGIDMVNNTVYFWRVRAEDNNGGKSAWSEGSFSFRSAVVSFASDQAGTSVYIDGNYAYLGRYIGMAPLSTQVSVGSHLVAFVKANYEPYYTVINVVDPVVDGGALSVSVKMIKAARISHGDAGIELSRVVSGPSSPFVVDYDNDGRKDIVVGSGDGKIYLFIAEPQMQSDGTTKDVPVGRGPLNADGTDIYVGSRAAPFFVDFNNDGRKDILVGSGDGRIYLYLNNGTDNVPEYATAGTLKDGSGSDIKMDGNSAPTMVDYNNDGRKDLSIGSSDGAVRLYLNTGTDAAPLFAAAPQIIKAIDAVGVSRDVSAGSDSRVFFVDWNSDGKKDLLVGRGSLDAGGNSANLYLNIGTDAAPVFMSVSALPAWIRDLQKIRGNREYIPYLGYNKDLGDVAPGSGSASVFIVNWEGTSARDLMTGASDGGVMLYLSGE